MNESFDCITHQDRIYQFYLDKEIWITQQVKNLNLKLRQANKPKIILGLFDVLPEETLYGPGDDVLLVEHFLTNKNNIAKPLVEFSRSVYGIYYMPEKIWHRNITKDFNCFINRNDPIRQTWFYLLYDRKLLGHAYASFSGHSRLSDVPDLEYLDYIQQQALGSFESIHRDIRKLVPYKNFVETGDLCDTILSTKFSIIIETYFERTDAITFSEKTFRALQTPRPWLLFHATGAVQELRNIGFYVYDDFVDHSYDVFDTATNSSQRQESILAQAQKLMSMDVSNSMLTHWETMTKKNCEILKDLNSSWHQDALTSIETSYNMALMK